MTDLLLSIEPREMRMALMRSGILQDLAVERTRSRQLTGNIYRGVVTNILPNIQSAFIDVGEDSAGFIHISDIEDHGRGALAEGLDFDEESQPSDTGAATDEITSCLQLGQTVLVQVAKEPIGNKGARLTSNIAIAGRYLVLLPKVSHRGVSRKIEDRATRDRLKRLVRSFEMPDDMGLICRTASQQASSDQLEQEAHELSQQWEKVAKGFDSGKKPALLLEESDFVRRAVLLAVDRRVDRILVNDQATVQRVRKLYAPYQEEHPVDILHYTDKVSLFEQYGVQREIEKALRRKVWLPSGGYLFFDRTEAMTTIDVNSGRSLNTAEPVPADVDESLLRINLEAAEEIARQLRIRNIGGLVICDFIDMRLRRNQKRLLDRLKDAMKEDSARCTILGMSEFGLVEMTRQRHRESLQQVLMMPCPYCSGSGQIKSPETMILELERTLKPLLAKTPHVKAQLHPEVIRAMTTQDRQHLKRLSDKAKGQVDIDSDENLHLNEVCFFDGVTGKRMEV